MHRWVVIEHVIFGVESNAFVQVDPEIAHTVDDETKPSNIARLFADNYRELYTRVPYDAGEMKRLSDDIDRLLLTDQIPRDCTYTCSDIKTVVSHLIHHKSDGNLGPFNYHIINASDLYFTRLAILFTVFVIHGRVPGRFLLRTIEPIPNGNTVEKADS